MFSALLWVVLLERCLLAAPIDRRPFPDGAAPPLGMHAIKGNNLGIGWVDLRWRCLMDRKGRRYAISPAHYRIGSAAVRRCRERGRARRIRAGRKGRIDGLSGRPLGMDRPSLFASGSCEAGRGADGRPHQSFLSEHRYAGTHVTQSDPAGPGGRHASVSSLVGAMASAFFTNVPPP